MYSSGPPDLAGVFRRLNGESDAVEKAIQMHDATNLKRPLDSNTGGIRLYKKGDQPQGKDQKKWAPLHYFVPTIAGSLVAMTNKLGSWQMALSPGVKHVSDYMLKHETENLKCLISENDANNMSRYASDCMPFMQRYCI